MSVTLAQVSGVQAKRRRGQPGNTKIGHELAQPGEHGVVHTLFAVRNEMDFIDNDQMAFAQRLWIAVDRIDRSEEYLRVGVAVAESVAVDANRRFRPDIPKLA